MVQEIIVGPVVVAALVWLVRNLVARARGGGCACENAPQCPYAGDEGCALRAHDICGSKAADRGG